MLIRKIRYIFFFLLLGIFAKAQLLVSPNSNASTLVNQIVGNNVTITNVSLNCNSQGSGIFLSNGSNIGLTTGILLTTGLAQTAMGPNNQTGAGTGLASCSTCPNFSDGDLSSIEPQAKYDGCRLEFDIKPICNKLQIRYVFASEEYPEYVGHNFNDAFGFFISGPNPGGGSYSGYNIARLSNGTPVSIDNINSGSNGSYYVDNTGGATVQYDGFTTPLTALADVVPCATYHLKLVIADAGDDIYDSGVFLEYKGIGCANNSTPSINTATTVSKCDLNNGSASVAVSNYTGAVTYAWSPGGQTSATATGLAPGNYTCSLNFQQPCPNTQTVSVTVPHDAGFTYSTSITNIKCPQDANGSATITVNGGTTPYSYNWNSSPAQFTNIGSNFSMGQYVCTITDASGCVKKDTVKIFATTTLTMHPTSSTALCNNPTGSAQSNASGGVPAYTYTWSTMPVQTTANATSLLPGTYSVTVTDNDGCKLTNTVVVNNFIPVISINDSLIDPTCNQQNGAIYISSVTGGTGPYTYTWSTTPAQNTQNVTGLLPGTYTVQVNDVNHCPATESYTLVNHSSLPLIPQKKDDKCDQQKGWASAIVLGGSPGFTYAWNNGQTTQTATGLGQGKYWVDITDAVGCKATDTIRILNHNDVFNGSVELDPNEPEVNNPFTVTLHPTSVWNLNYAFESDGLITNDTLNRFNYQDYGWYNITYYMVSDDGCRDTLRYDFFVKDFMTLYVPNTFTPNGDLENDIFFAKGTLIREFKMYIFDRWGQLVFKSDAIEKGWDGTYKGGMAPIDTYVYKIIAKDYYNREQTFVGHVNLIR
ncbi:MAG: choice-of-anchor L domain-containing protein [Bacteroidetes bacterium]|nr:choice-of-anchor L domain-containing protein [Bacteroidota bacterium]